MPPIAEYSHRTAAGGHGDLRDLLEIAAGPTHALAGDGVFMVRRIKESAPGLSDAAIADTVRSALNQQPRPAGIQVEVEHGYVTLAGHVPSLHECNEVERVVRQSQGVIGVINNISIDAAARR